MKTDKIWSRNGFTMRLIEPEDKDKYYEGMFTNMDAETIRMTGSKDNYTKEEVEAYFDRIVGDSDRYDFIIVSDDGTIVGESVLDDTDNEVGSANFTIGISNRDYFGRGLGSWAIRNTLECGFEVLKLN